MNPPNPPRLCGCGQPSLPKTHACADCDREARDYPPIPPAVKKAMLRKTANVGASTMLSYLIARHEESCPDLGRWLVKSS